MTTAASTLSALRKKIWTGSIPIEVRLASADCKTYDKSEAYIFFAPRISYLPLLLPRIRAFFHSDLIDSSTPSSAGWFTFEDVPLKWHHPVGLLFDLYSRAKEQLVAETHGKDEGVVSEVDEDCLPWRLTVHFSDWPSDVLVPLDAEGKVLQDAFNNSVKEASYIRHGSGKVIMSLGKDATEQLWRAVQDTDSELYASANQQLLYRKGEAIRHIPIKIYLPALADDNEQDGKANVGHLRVIQGLVTPKLNNRQTQSLGTALNSLIPALFPSRRSPLLAYSVLHGAIVPMSVGIEELAEYCAYADGFLHIAITMMG